jgi:uncharacterized protein (TIGR03083 family)
VQPRGEGRRKSMTAFREAYKQAAGCLVDTVAGIRVDQWDEPALGVWSVRDLTGHASGGLLLVERFSQVKPEQIELSSPVAYYRKAMSGARVNEQIAERGKDRGRELGDDPAGVLRELADRVCNLVDTLPDEHPMGSNIGGIRFVDYLPTRTLELVVHTLDLAKATGQQVQPPREATAVTMHLLADLALESGHAGEFALAATGRGLVDGRFSVIG